MEEIQLSVVRLGSMFSLCHQAAWWHRSVSIGHVTFLSSCLAGTLVAFGRQAAWRVQLNGVVKLVGAREDAVPCSCCVRSVVLVVEHIALALAMFETSALVIRRWKSTNSSSTWFAPSSWDSFLRYMTIRGTRWCLTHHLDATGECWVACHADQTTVCLARSAATDERLRHVTVGRDARFQG